MSTIAATVLLVFVGTFATPQNVPSTTGLPVFIAVLLLLVACVTFYDRQSGYMLMLTSIILIIYGRSSNSTEMFEDHGSDIVISCTVDDSGKPATVPPVTNPPTTYPPAPGPEPAPGPGPARRRLGQA